MVSSANRLPVDISVEASREQREAILSKGFVFLIATFCIVQSARYFIAAEGIVDFSGHALGRDFINKWAAAVLVLEGKVATIFDVAGFHGFQETILGLQFPLHLWSYPPTALLFVWPVGYLPYIAAYVLWTGLGLLLYMLAVSRLGLPRGVVLYLVLAPSSFVNAIAGQTGFFAAACLIAGLATVTRRPILAGVFFGLLSFKPQLGILVPIALVAARMWPTFAAAALTTVLLALTSILVFGIDSWTAYLTQNYRVTSMFLEQGTGMFMQMMPSIFMSGRLLGFGVEVAYWAQAVVSAGLAVGTFVVFRKWGFQPLSVAFLLIAAVMVTPYAHNYDMTLTSAAVILLSWHIGTKEPLIGERSFLALLWAWPLLIFFANHYGFPVSILVLVISLSYVVMRLCLQQQRR